MISTVECKIGFVVVVLLLLNSSEIFHIMATTFKKKRKCYMKTVKQMQIKRETRKKSASVLEMAFEQYSVFGKMQREGRIIYVDFILNIASKLP